MLLSYFNYDKTILKGFKTYFKENTKSPTLMVIIL